jgi:uncharacterized protein (TIGR00106 family)
MINVGLDTCVSSLSSSGLKECPIPKRLSPKDLIQFSIIKTLLYKIHAYYTLEKDIDRTLHAEISIIPIGTGVTSISREVAVAFDAIRKTDGIKATKLTAMGTQIEADNMKAIFNAIDAAHQAVKSAGVKRIVSNIKISERLDASRTLEAEVASVTNMLTKG